MSNVTKLPVSLKDNSKIVTLVQDFAGCQHRRAIVDEKLAELTCADCGERLNPIRFLADVAKQERMYEYAQTSIAAARKALEERSRCRCTKCGEWTEIRRVGNREVKRLRSQSNTGVAKMSEFRKVAPFQFCGIEYATVYGTALEIKTGGTMAVEGARRLRDWLTQASPSEHKSRK